MLALIERQNHETVRFTQTQLADDTGLTDRTVRDLLREAYDKGWIDRDRDGLVVLVVPETTSGRIRTLVPGRREQISLSGVGQSEGLRAKSYARQAREEALRRDAETVGKYYRDRLGKSDRFVWTKQREALIVARLRENDGNVSELLYVVDGLLRSPFHMGQTAESDGRKHQSPELIFRNRKQVETFSELSGWDGQEVHPYLVEPA